MGKRAVFASITALSLLAMVLSVTGCGSAIKYTKDAGTDTSRMTPYKKQNIDILVPPGYVEKEIPEGSYKQEGAFVKFLGSNPNVAFFHKKDNPDHFVVFCWDGWNFMSRGGLPDVARHLVKTSAPDSKMVAGTFELDSGVFKTKYFEMYSGNNVKEGKEMPVIIWIGWRFTGGVDCKYILVGTSYTRAPEFEDEFVSVMRNLK